MRSDDDLGFVTLTGIGHADLSWPISYDSQTFNFDSG